MTQLIMTHSFWPVAAAFLLVLLLLPPGAKLAARLGLLDHPGGRKQHEGEVPPVGGLVVFPVFMAMAAVFMTDWHDAAWFYGALALILITGALDDRFVIPPRTKFAIQFLAAFLIVLPGHARVAMLGDLFGFGPVGLSFMSIPFSIVAAVLLINAVNLMDGLDGLAGGMGVIVLGWMAACAAGSGNHNATAQVVVLCAALCGFLFYNLRTPFRRRASVFLGDAGSLALGLSISWYAIRLGGSAQPSVPPAAIAWMLGLPIMDTCGQFARRIREGRHPFSADQDHFHHHFVRVGLSPGQATAAVLALVFLYGLIGVGGLALGIPPWLLMYGWAALLLAHIALSMQPDRFRSLIAHVTRKTFVSP
jgi:UDP-GlcNAc:undecaprenyl-phosphate GlcNAc-1-phosphate transferase